MLLLGAATEKEALQGVPWSALLLVCGVALMTNVVEQLQGIAVLTQLLGRLAGAGTVAPVMALLAGMMSLVSSSSGVVLPTLIPTVRGVALETGGTVPPEALISVIAVGAHLASVFPFSTLGAFAVAAAGDGNEKDTLFRQLCLSGLVYLLLGAPVSYLLVMLF